MDRDGLQPASEAVARMECLRGLRSCVVTDEPRYVEEFAYFLNCASLPPTTRLDVTLTSWSYNALKPKLIHYNFFRTPLINLAFRRFDQTAPMAVKFSLSHDGLGVLQVLSGGLERFVLKTSSDLADICTSVWNLSPAEFLAFQLAYGHGCDAHSPRAPHVVTLTLELQARGLMKSPSTFRLLLNVFDSIGRLEVHGGDVQSLFAALGSKCGTALEPYARIEDIDIADVYMEEEDLNAVLTAIGDAFDERAQVPAFKTLSLSYNSRAGHADRSSMEATLRTSLGNVVEHITIGTW
ncbi:hypothetical protein C8Q76DRAFT_725912 [Earliella scabrosa]|nr:hypothetical protein C8Q76DRAFT_725912 [Earliella scabrosa]